MSAAAPRNLSPHWPRVRAIALVRIRRVIRTRIALAALLLALTPWLLVESHVLLIRLMSLAEFTVVGLTVIAAGVIGDDLDSGEYAVVITHDAAPVEVLAGQALASLALIALLATMQLPIALHGTTIPSLFVLAQCFAWLAASLAGWLALMLLLGTMLDGKANAVAAGALFAIVPLFSGPGILDRAPQEFAGPVRAALQILPQVAHVRSEFSALLERTPRNGLLTSVLLLSPVFYFALAAVRLSRLEPAGRLTQ